MFRKKENPMPVQSHVLDGRYLKVEPNRRGGYVDYKHDNGYIQSYPLSSQRGISETDISESYLSEKDEKEFIQRRQDIEKLNKSSRRKIPFLQKKKKETGTSFTSELRLTAGPDIDGDNEEDADDIGDITTYSEGIPITYESIKKNGLNPTGSNQTTKRLDLDDQYAQEAQMYERMNYIVENYRPPPPYPGNASVDSQGKSMIQQLLQEKANKQIKDNASMINYCQVDAPKDVSVDNITNIMRASTANANGISPQMRASAKDNPNGLASLKDATAAGTMTVSQRPDPGHALKGDKLVMRTLHSPRASGALHQMGFNFGTLTSNPVGAREIFDSATTNPSEIYPRDYDYDDNDDEVVNLNVNEGVKGDRKISIESNNGSEGISQRQFPRHEVSSDGMIRNQSDQTYTVDIVPTYGSNKSKQDAFASEFVNRAGFEQHPERDYDIPEGPDYEPEEYEPQSHDEVENSDNSMYCHRYEKSETYVPPSPYMYADIPEWLQVYAKASPELDTLMKWDMFRLPELDCWQTMLKRLYMKELEQVVYWFEEYRQSMQHEIEGREEELGIMRLPVQVVDQRMKKTDV